MTAADAGIDASAGTWPGPSEAVAERLNDPAVAAALVTLLDNAELLSTLVLGLGGFMQRGDLIMDSVAESVNEFKAAGGVEASGLPSISDVGSLASQLTQAAPLLSQLLDSAMTKPETIGLLSDVADAANEGVAAAQANQTKVRGVRGLLSTLRDPEVQQGLGVLIEVSRSLGRRLG